ncbi:MAG: hypothetical protein U0R80_08015 [Nocardioidaceae bacterium]
MGDVLAAPEVEVQEMSVEAGREMLEAQTYDKLGISRVEFLARLDAGEYDDTADEQILRLAMFAPFGR